MSALLIICKYTIICIVSILRFNQLKLFLYLSGRRFRWEVVVSNLVAAEQTELILIKVHVHDVRVVYSALC